MLVTYKLEAIKRYIRLCSPFLLTHAILCCTAVSKNIIRSSRSRHTYTLINTVVHQSTPLDAKQELAVTRPPLLRYDCWPEWYLE